MDAAFWHQKWENRDTPFHESETNALLLKYFKELSLPEGSRVFVPLCGKTRDIAWLLSQGYRAAGAELSELAVTQLFAELGVEPVISQAGRLKHYRAPDLDIFVGDLFELSQEVLGPVDAVYDRAALVALPKEMRRRYTARLMEITGKAKQLLILYEYDQNLQEGPPFSISTGEVNQHYENSYDMTRLASVEVPGGLKGKCTAKENVWLLKNG